MKIRIAREYDKEYVMSWIKDIWSGHDYIPYTWDEWLTDPNGTLYVVEDDDKAVALWHIIWLDNGVAWLEGMRVKPNYCNRGIATMTLRYSIKLAREKGFRHVMLATSSDNKIVIRIMGKIGFNDVGEYLSFKGNVFNVKKASSEVVYDMDWNHLISRYHRLRGNNFIIGFIRPWIFTELNKDIFEVLHRDKNIYASKNGEALAIIGRPFKHRGIKTFYIRYLDGYNKTDIKDIVENISYRALEMQCKGLYGYIPSDDELAETLEGLNIQVDKCWRGLVYRYKIS